jgi:Leucine-rich repeat (LRR) protein
VLPTLTFENLNSLEQLNLQNNKMDRLPEELMEPVMDTLRILDATGKYKNHFKMTNGKNEQKSHINYSLKQTTNHLLHPKIFLKIKI